MVKIKAVNLIQDFENQDKFIHKRMKEINVAEEFKKDFQIINNTSNERKQAREYIRTNFFGESSEREIKSSFFGE